MINSHDAAVAARWRDVPKGILSGRAATVVPWTYRGSASAGARGFDARARIGRIESSRGDDLWAAYARAATWRRRVPECLNTMQPTTPAMTSPPATSASVRWESIAGAASGALNAARADE